MIQVSEIDETVEARMREFSPVACGALEDMRGLARDAAKFIEKAALPQQFHTRAIALLAEIENLEGCVSEYAVSTSEEAA